MLRRRRTAAMIVEWLLLNRGPDIAPHWQGETALCGSCSGGLKCSRKNLRRDVIAETVIACSMTGLKVDKGQPTGRIKQQPWDRVLSCKLFAA
jgi:hypothetical protein